MKGDFTRFTHDPDKHYSGVLKQQGRVDLDADWNEYIQIQDYLNRTEAQDVIGRCGVPNSTPEGFKITRASGDNTRLEVMPGRIYVNGILCEPSENESLSNPANSGIYLAYLDVWQRHITAVEDPDLPEIALDGVDTTTRIKTEWQVRFKDVSDTVDSEHLDCQPFCCKENPWEPEEAISTGKLAARAEEVEGEVDLCEVQAQAGYVGLENRLYRVEIHAGGDASSATFKWSRDNGAVVFPIQTVEIQSGKSTITLKQLGKDEVLTLHVGDWVEILGDETELECQSGILAQVASESDGTDLDKGVIVVNTDISAYQTENHLKIRRWDHKASGTTSLVDGAIPVTEGEYVALEDGVEVCFDSGTYQPGDYWLIPARTKIRDVLWPQVDDDPEFQYRHGIKHYYCALALAEFTNSAWNYPQDCRRIFPPLTELQTSGGCCVPVREGENIQQAIDSAISAGGGCICLCGGVHQIEGPLFIHQARNLTIHGINTATVLHFQGMNNNGEGGILLDGCEKVTLGSMLVLGDDLSALISIRSGEEMEPTQNITLRDLTLFNRTLSNTGNNCAVRLGNSQGIEIENCRMVAETGIVSLFGDRLPEPDILNIYEQPQAHGDELSDLSHAPRSRRDMIEVVENDQLSLSPTSGPPGTAITVTGNGFPPSSKVEIQFADASTDAVTDANGGFQITMTVPAGTEPGDYLITVTDASGQVSRAVFTITEQAPEPIGELNYGIGVHDVRMKNVSILYREYGIWTLKSVGWHLSDCDISLLKAKWSTDVDSGSAARNLLKFIESAKRPDGESSGGIAAIQALIWQACTIKGCQLTGAVVMNVCAFLHGSVSDSTLQAGKYGLRAMWIHNARLSDNTIHCNNGVGFSFAGSHRVCIRNNQVRQAICALENSNPATWLRGLSEYLMEVVSQYPVPEAKIPSISADAGEKSKRELIALWVLMEETCQYLGLEELRDRVQDFVDTFENIQNIPVLLLASAYLYPKLGDKSELKVNLVLPIISPQISGNDFEAEKAVVWLRNFIPMGGMQITENRLHTLTGQAVRVKAVPVTVNPHIIIIAWRLIFMVLPIILKRLREVISGTEMPAAQKTAIINIIATLGKLLSQWGAQSESILETDYRIEDNNIRSQRTAIVSNLFELAIHNNFINMQESPVEDEEIGIIIGILEQFGVTKELAAGIRLRSGAMISAYTQTINFNTDAPEMQSEMAEASCLLNSRVTNPVLKSEFMVLNKAVNEADIAQIQESLGSIGQILESYVDTCGIWVKGAGCRIDGNQVLVPMDADRKTWAQGGIRFWDDEGTPIWMFVFLQQILQLLMPDLEIPSLLSVTETLIDNNEVIRGTNHGIEINGIANMPMGMGLTDLKIRGNQIRDMVGAGITFDEKSLSVGVDIEGNSIMDCGSITLHDFFASNKGGIVIRNAALCRIHSNRIRCSSSLQNNLGLYAVDLRTIYGLTLTDNHIQHSENSSGQLDNIMLLSQQSPLIGFTLANMCGALRLSEIHGEVSIHHNDILLSMGTGGGLVLGEFSGSDEWQGWALRTMAKAQSINVEQTGAAASDTGEQTVITNVSIQGNHFESLVNQPFAAFLLANLNELNFSGNNVRASTAGTAPGIIWGINRGVIASNILDTLQIDQVGGGVISGNLSNQPITIPTGVVHGLNTP